MKYYVYKKPRHQDDTPEKAIRVSSHDTYEEAKAQYEKLKYSTIWARAWAIVDEKGKIIESMKI